MFIGQGHGELWHDVNQLRTLKRKYLGRFPSSLHRDREFSKKIFTVLYHHTEARHSTSKQTKITTTSKETANVSLRNCRLEPPITVDHGEHNDGREDHVVVQGERLLDDIAVVVDTI
jgi:hypothetical protein